MERQPKKKDEHRTPVEDAEETIAAAVPPPEPEPVAPEAGSYAVAPGKAIHCARGYLEQGAPVEAKDLGDGADGLLRLLEQGYIVKH